MEETKDIPLRNPRWELYCQKRLEGLTQRQAMLAVWPDRKRWKPATIDTRACELEREREIQGRLAALKRIAAERSIISRAEVIAGMSETFGAGMRRIRKATDANPLDYTAVNAVTQLGKTLLDALPADERPEELGGTAHDFALLIGRDFFEPHRLLHTGAQDEFWSMGGRGSLKSSWASLELVQWIEDHPDQHAAALMKRKDALRNAAYAQVVWAIDALGLTDAYDMPVSTLTIKKRATGQLIYFRGCDNAQKSKGIKPPFGFIGFAWFEEADQFKGMGEIRTVLQSVARGGDRTVRAYTYNPPRTRDNWANREAERRKAAGQRVFSSNYLEAPPEWLGKQFLEDAEELKESDPEAYAHEYMGEPVGYGGQVFDRIELREVTDEEIAAFDNLKAGQDFGWFPDPWAFTLSEWQPGRHTVVTFMELGGNKVQAPDEAERIKAALTWSDKPGGEPVYHALRVLSDDAEPDQIAAQRDCGVDARSAGKGGNRALSYRFMQSVTWVIDPRRCPNLAREVQEAEFEQDPATGEYSGDYPDGNDHWIDATRYAFMGVATRRGAYRHAGKEKQDGR